LVVVPHDVVDGRSQFWVSVVVVAAHVPCVSQVYVVACRDCVPLQGFDPATHALHAVYCGAWHSWPTGFSVQACISLVVAAWQVPAPSQVLSVRVRDCWPVVAQVPDAPHIPQVPYVVVAHVTPEATFWSAGHASSLPEHRSSRSHASVAGRHTRDGPTCVHTPSTLAPRAAAHASQAPLHARSQHTPSAQEPLVHSAAALHGAPFIFCAAQYCPLHHVPDGHPLPQGIGQSGSVPLHCAV